MSLRWPCEWVLGRRRRWRWRFLGSQAELGGAASTASRWVPGAAKFGDDPWHQQIHLCTTRGPAEQRAHPSVSQSGDRVRREGQERARERERYRGREVESRCLSRLKSQVGERWEGSGAGDGTVSERRRVVVSVGVDRPTGWIGLLDRPTGWTYWLAGPTCSVTLSPRWKFFRPARFSRRRWAMRVAMDPKRYVLRSRSMRSRRISASRRHSMS